MAGHPIYQSSFLLNKALATIVFADHPEFNITVDDLTEDGITMRPQNEATNVIPTMNAIVLSVDLKQIVQIEVNLNRSSGAYSNWIKQAKKWSILGTCTLTPDTAAEPSFSIYSCSIQHLADEDFSGHNPTAKYVLSGYFAINNEAY